MSAFHGDYDKLYQNFYTSGYDEENTPDEVTLDGYVDTTRASRTPFSRQVVKEGMLGGLGHTLLAGVESISTTSDQDRYNSFWDTTQDDKETFPYLVTWVFVVE